MKRCDKNEEFLARFVHGETLPAEREEFERHLSGCDRCAAVYPEIADVDRVLRGLPGKEADPPPHLRTRILAHVRDEARHARGREALGWGFGQWAAVAGGLAACAFALFMVFRGVSSEVRVASAPPSARPASPAPAGGSEARAVPAPGRARRADAPPAVAAAPRVQVIREVKIFFYYPPAQQVAVTGDFNGWDPDGVPLKHAGKPGLWTTNLRIKPGAYSYNFIVDGETLVPDPNAPAQAPDGYGGTNSIMLVKGDRPT